MEGIETEITEESKEEKTAEKMSIFDITISNIERELINSLLYPGNHDIYEKKLTASTSPVPKYDVKPWCIYFIYITIDACGRPDVRHYLHVHTSEIEHQDVPDHIKDLVLRARRNLNTPLDNCLHGLKWDRKSYVAIMVDFPNWSLAMPGGRAAVFFNTRKGSMPNHSFFDARDTFIDKLPLYFTGDTGKRSIMYFVNHLKKSEFGDDLGLDQGGGQVPGQSEPFVFDIYFVVETLHSNPTPTEKDFTIFVFDPDGTNEGPPIGPPP